MTCDLKMEENLFSETFQTSKADEHLIVSARMEEVKVELMNVNKAFSCDFHT